MKENLHTAIENVAVEQISRDPKEFIRVESLKQSVAGSVSSFYDCFDTEEDMD
jgi:hypothetical protein